MHLGEFCKREDAVAFRAGQTIFRQGDRGGSMYVVLEGQLEVVLNGETIDFVGPGEVVGEMSLVDGQPRSATVVARSDGYFVELDETKFLSTTKKSPKFALVVLAIVSRRLRRMNELARS
jgi:CRP-like cAMP-binding protein